MEHLQCTIYIYCTVWRVNNSFYILLFQIQFLINFVSFSLFVTPKIKHFHSKSKDHTFISTALERERETETERDRDRDWRSKI